MPKSLHPTHTTRTTRSTRSTRTDAVLCARLSASVLLLAMGLAGCGDETGPTPDGGARDGGAQDQGSGDLGGGGDQGMGPVDLGGEPVCEGSFVPRLFAKPRAWFTSCVLAFTNPSRAWMRIRSRWACSPRWTMGFSKLGSMRPRRARSSASTVSLFESFAAISRTRRGFATIAWCPQADTTRLIQGECVPTSRTTRLGA